ncbi:MAG: hypothetical protein GC156_03795 [Actinomycetales bacterium]|nr:hypothetical protein [Actinomycetales bacterium]
MTDPIIDAGDVAQVQRACRVALAAEVAGGSRLDGVPSVDWSAVHPSGLLHAVTLHRVAPLLTSQLTALAAPDPIASALRARARGDAVRALRLSVETSRALQVLADADVPALVYKGIALSLQTTGGLAARGFGDIDILVRPADVPRAHEALESAGWAGEAIPDAPRWWGHYLRVRRERSYVGADSAIDLHWRIGWHERPLPGAEVLLARPASVRIADAEVPTLSLPDAFAVVCYSAAIDRYNRLRSIVDIVRLARRDDVRLPVDAHWRLRRVIGEAVALADDLLGGIPEERRRAFVPEGSVDLDRLRSTYAHASVRRPWIDDDIPLGEIVGIYRESGRYAGAPAAIGMAVVDGLFPPERLPPGTGFAGTVAAMGGELGDLFRRRVLVRPSESD